MKTDYYVYLHKTLDGDVFYAGKGRLNRAWDKSRRSKGWNEVSSNGYSVEIYRDNLSEKVALVVEEGLITSLPNLVNKLTFNPVKFDDYSDYFTYDPESPSGLTRIKGVLGGSGHSHEIGKLGHCGCKVKRTCGGQHWVIGFRNRLARVHRIIWQLVNGEIPEGFVIDHIDGNSLHNSISNLRLISQAENARNSRRTKNNTSGVTGVRLAYNKSKNSYWSASYYDSDGKHILKAFSILKLGNDEAFKQACEWRQQMIAELNLQGAGYTERHGT